MRIHERQDWRERITHLRLCQTCRSDNSKQKRFNGALPRQPYSANLYPGNMVAPYEGSLGGESRSRSTPASARLAASQAASSSAPARAGESRPPTNQRNFCRSSSSVGCGTPSHNGFTSPETNLSPLL